MRPVLAVSVLTAIVLVGAGCGGQSAEASFRTKANQACRSAVEHAKLVAGNSRKSVNAGLALFADMSDRLARVHPPASDRRTYEDLVSRLRDGSSFTRAHEAEIYELDHRIQLELSKNGLHLSPKPPQHVFIPRRLIARVDALARRPIEDAQLAGQDARKLQLTACAFHTHRGSASLQQSGSPIGTVTDSNP